MYCACAFICCSGAMYIVYVLFILIWLLFMNTVLCFITKMFVILLQQCNRLAFIVTVVFCM